MTPSLRTVPLSKHHGLGNDFLVLADLALSATLTVAERAALAIAACDRHRGIGADGLLFALPVAHVDAPAATGTEAIAMRLHNADGSVAEMSGNGIRCFAQAVIDRGLVNSGEVQIATDGGLRIVRGERSNASGEAWFRVDMGVAVVDSIEIPTAATRHIGTRRVLTVDLGNPHIVIEGDAALPASGNEIATFGPAVEEPFLSTKLHGINVEVTTPQRQANGALNGELDMVVWERGVGITQACGTGSVATAVAAHTWGLVGPSTKVHQPGGVVGVEIDGDRVTLIGPTQFIADVSFTWHQGQES